MCETTDYGFPPCEGGKVSGRMTIFPLFRDLTLSLRLNMFSDEQETKRKPKIAGKGPKT